MYIQLSQMALVYSSTKCLVRFIGARKQNQMHFDPPHANYLVIKFSVNDVGISPHSKLLSLSTSVCLFLQMYPVIKPALMPS